MLLSVVNEKLSRLQFWPGKTLRNNMLALVGPPSRRAGPPILIRKIQGLEDVRRN